MLELVNLNFSRVIHVQSNNATRLKKFISRKPPIRKILGTLKKIYQFERNFKIYWKLKKKRSPTKRFPSTKIEITNWLTNQSKELRKLFQSKRNWFNDYGCESNGNRACWKPPLPHYAKFQRIIRASDGVTHRWNNGVSIEKLLQRERGGESERGEARG